MNRFTLWGVYQYDPTLFDDVQVPDNVDKDILISCIMQTSGDLKPYYQQPAWLKHNITDWFRRMYFSIDKMMAAIKSEFNPVENYDRYEERNTSESEYSHDSASEMAYNSMSTSLSESQWNSMAQSQEQYSASDL